ncbi:hypothetical protein P7C73_g1151, partial [Tremellales sp. Uapishka_1]
MFSRILFTFLGILAAAAAPTERDTETHTITLVNNCGAGTPLWLYQGADAQGSTTITGGPVLGGVAWLDGFAGPGGTCTSSGVNCNDVEFTLTNVGDPGDNAGDTQNAINYSEQTQGNHVFAYNVDAVYTNGCAGDGPPGACEGTDSTTCPGVFTGTDTTDGIVYQCEAQNIGITITFCP